MYACTVSPPFGNHSLNDPSKVLGCQRVTRCTLFPVILFSGPVDPPSGFQWVRLAWTNRPLSANAFLSLASNSQDEVKSSAKSSQLAAAPIAALGGPGKNQRAVLWQRPSMAAKEISIRAIFFLNYFDAVSFRLSSCRLLSCVLSAFIVRFPLGLRGQLRRISLGPQTVPSVDEEIEGWGKGGWSCFDSFLISSRYNYACFRGSVGDCYGYRVQRAVRSRLRLACDNDGNRGQFGHHFSRCCHRHRPGFLRSFRFQSHQGTRKL